MAQTKYLDYAGLSYYDGKIKAHIAEQDAEVLQRSAVTFTNAVSPDSGDAATVVVTQNWTEPGGTVTPTEIGRIHIPLDKYVSAGAVATRQIENPETHELETKTYIDLTVTNGAGAAGSSTVSVDISSVAGDISAIQHAIDILNSNDTVEGSVAHSIKVAIEALDSEVITSGTPAEGQVLATATVATGDVNVLTGVTEADGKLSAATATTLKKLASTGAAEDVTIADAGDYFTATNVEGALTELAEASAGGVASKTVYLQDESAGQSDYAKVYKLYQGANAPDAQTDPAALIGTINIPKDLVVQSGSVVEIFFNEADNTLHEGSLAGPDVTALIIPEGQTATAANAGKYIKLTIQNQTNPLYIAVKDLVDVYTGGTTAEAVVSIDASNVITVTIDTIAATKISIADTGDHFTSTDVEGALAELAEAAAGTNGAFVFKGSVATVPTTGEVGYAYLVGTAPNVKLMICTTASGESTDATYTEIAINTAMTGTGFQTAGNAEAETPIDPVPLTIKEYIDKLIFVGTQAEYDAAVAAGTLLTNTFSVITDDDGNELTPISDSEIDNLFS